MLQPRRCAEGRVPYFMRVEVVRRLRHVAVEFFTLAGGSYTSTARAASGELLKVDLPFPIEFDPAVLLP
ncbi:hypothetical protein ABZ671_29885 [Micromonospora sp. NPDC006766]|uniref:hypothetical protein n=1 Tax=Micromonospora sp. NPDC006766 TaxID=3154778 RepID=UPI003411A70B